MIILVDFDGTCVPQLDKSHETPHDYYDTGAGEVLRDLAERGHDIVLWTARNESPENPYNWDNDSLRSPNSLQEALIWFNSEGIPLSGVNDWEGSVARVGDSRKLVGDLLIDDLSIGIPKKYIELDTVDTETGELMKIKTFHVDWEAIRHELITQGIL